MSDQQEQSSQHSGGRDNNNEPKNDQIKKNKNGKFNKNRNKNRNQDSNTVGSLVNARFKGGTSGMNGHVFQLFSEQKNRSQFQDTLEQLKVYAATSYKDHVKHLQVLFSDLNEPKVQKPSYPSGTKDKDGVETIAQLDLDIYAEEVTQYVKTKRSFDNTIHSIFCVVWGQCSQLMQHKIRSIHDYKKIHDTSSVHELLRHIRKISDQIEESAYIFDALDEARKKVYFFYQKKDESNMDHLKNLKHIVETIESHGGSILVDPTPCSDYEKSIDNSFTTVTDAEYLERAKERYMALILLKRADKHRYGELLTSLRNNKVLKNDLWPATLTDAFDMLENFTPINKSTKINNNNELNNDKRGDKFATGVQFLHDSDVSTITTGSDGKTHNTITCHYCKDKGHYKSACPKLDENGNAINQSNNINAQEQMDDTTTAGSTNVQLSSGIMNLVNALNGSDHQSFQFCQATRTQHQFLQSVFDNKKDILLDSGSDCSVFCDKDLVTNIRPARITLTASTNGGIQRSTQEADVEHFFPVWYNPSSLINILSFAEVSAKFRMTYDNRVDPAIFVHLSDTRSIKFLPIGKGLYTCDRSEFSNNKNKNSFFNYSFLNSVSENLEKYTRREIEGAMKARLLYRALNYPSYTKLVKLLETNYIRNCPITADDVRRSLDIWGPDIASLKGKMVRKKGAGALFQYVPIPTTILDTHPTVRLCIDLLFINKIPFLHTISRNYQFRTIEDLPSRTKGSIWNALKKAINIYVARGLRVVLVEADNEFEPLRENLLQRGINLDICGADSHVGPVERSNRTIKERGRSTVQSLPFTKMPRQMVIGFTTNATKNLNVMPGGDACVSRELSPLTLITGAPSPDYEQITAVNFGDYVQVHEENGLRTNSNDTRSVGAIALYPSGNNQNSWYFLSLNTGRVLHRFAWTPLPLPNDVIKRVIEMADAQNQPIIANNFIFEYTPGVPIEDEDDNVAIIDAPENFLPQHVPPPIPIVDAPVNEPTIGDDFENDEAHPDREAIADEIRAIPDIIENNNDDDSITPDIDQDIEINLDEHFDNPVEENDLAHDQGALDQEQVEQVDGHNNGDREHNDTPSTPPPPRNSRYHLRDRKPVNYTLFARNRQQFVQKMIRTTPKHDIVGNRKNLKTKKKIIIPVTNLGDMFKETVRIIMTQMSGKAGIKKHGQAAIDALFKEYAQLNDKSVFCGVNPNNLSIEEKRQALRLVELIKEKRCGLLKGRACADGRPQRKFVSKEESASPTVSLEGLILSTLIDAREERDVATADVSGAYLHANMDDFVIVKLTGQTVKIMCDVNSEWKELVIEEKGQEVLYLQLKKALYGCIKSAILWYECFAEQLQKMGFELNPYDPCIANKMINGKQCTIAWYVDDCKISHVDSKQVDAILVQLEKQFGKLTITRGKKHTYIGMDIDFLSEGRVSILMKDHLLECIETFESIDGKIESLVTTPAAHNLFDIDSEAKLLDKNKSEILHHIVAKLLFVCKRARLDVQLPIAFLCSRVSCSTTQDWQKLKRTLSYIKKTIEMPRIISACSFDALYTYVDASYAPHQDMRSHTGGLMSFGLGVINTKSSKQKLNTKSSTEAEIVGASDYIPWTLWTKWFLQAQGYTVDQNIFYQDNQSAMKLETNGIKSSGEKTRHINIRYFFIKDVIKREAIDLKYCPTESMVADFFTKPLQGKLFKYLRDIIMGITHLPSPLTLEERVGKRESHDQREHDKKNTNKNVVSKPVHVVEERSSLSKKTSANSAQNKRRPQISWSDVVKGTS